MAKFIPMPKLGLTMTEGTVGKWLVNEGETVSVGDKLFEAQTDKLVNTVESGDAGVIRKILVTEGETVGVLVPVAIIAGDGDEDISALLAEADGAAPAPEAEPQPEEAPKPEPKAEKPAPAPKAEPEVAKKSGRIVAAPAARRLANNMRADLSRIEGSGPKGRIVVEDVIAYTGPTRPLEDGERVIATPAARALAKEKGLNLEDILGTGPEGRMTLEDVIAYEKAAPNVKATPLAAKMAADKGVDLADIDTADRIYADDISTIAGASRKPREEVVPMSPMRKTIARRMVESQQTAAIVNFDISIDMTEIIALRERLKAKKMGVSYTDLIVKMASIVLLEYPVMNCTMDDDNLIFRNYVNMGVAVAIEDGLLVPVVKDTHLKTVNAISKEIAQLARDARNNVISMDALSGATFTISNLGMYGIESFTPIINQPEMAILGVNAMRDEVLVIDGEMQVRPMMKFSLSADHRIIDGAVAAEFLARFKELMENPSMLLAI